MRCRSRPLRLSSATVARDFFEGMRSRHLPEPFVRSYPAFWNQLHSTTFKDTRLSHDPRVFYTTDRPFLKTQFGRHWVRPLGFVFSAGLSIDQSDQGSPLQLILYRAKSRTGFTPTELRFLSVVQPHLQNLYSLFCRIQGKNVLTDAKSHLEEFTQLTKREKEVAALLCLGSNTLEASSRLFISPATTYRHISNMFEKLGVSSRPALVAKLMQIRLRKSFHGLDSSVSAIRALFLGPIRP